MSCEHKTIATIPELKQIQELFGFSEDENWLNAIYYSLSPTGELFVFAHGSKIILLNGHWNRELQLLEYTISWKFDLDNQNDIITSILCIPIYGQSNNAQSSTEWTCIVVGQSNGTVSFFTDSGMELLSKQWQNETVQSIKAQSGKRLNEELYINYISCVCIIQGNNLVQILKSVKHQLQKVSANRNTYGVKSKGQSSSGTSSTGTSKMDLQRTIDSLPFRKWGYGGSKNPVINDTVVVGPQKSCIFDHLLSTSIEGGFYAKFRSAPPQNSLLLTTGLKPYIGFHNAKEGFVQPVLADVARAVAGKIKSSLMTWITGPSNPDAANNTTTKTSAAPQPQPITPSEPMSLRYGLCDIQRTGLSVWLAPGNKLAAVADTLGRIILVDCAKGIALRVWKGYREAQCGFILVNEKLRNSHHSQSQLQHHQQQRNRRHALFLIIYAPRRSCLEIWSMERGPKIAAFNTTKFGQLIYNTHNLMGTIINAIPQQSQHHGTTYHKIKYNSTNGCVFFDPIEKSLKELNIPFHCALNESNSKTAKDLHLLRRLKMCLRGGSHQIGTESQPGADSVSVELVTTDTEPNVGEPIINEIRLNCEGLQTDEIRIQCIEMLITHNKIKPLYLKLAIDIIIEQIAKDDEFAMDACDDDNNNNNNNNDDDDRKSIVSSNEITNLLQRNQLKNLSMNYKKLVEFYLYVNGPESESDINTTLASSDCESDTPREFNDATEQINLSIIELDNLQKLIDLSIYERNGQESNDGGPKVTFQEHKITNEFIEYLTIFDRTHSEIILNNEKSNQFASVGYDLFHQFLEKNRSLKQFLQNAIKSEIASDDLMKLLLHYWLSKPFLYTRIEDLIMDLSRFSLILQHICALANDKIYYDYNSICLWWQNVREILLESTSALRGLLAAIMCRNYSNKYRQRQNSNDSSSNEDDVWEQVTHEAAQWSLLISKLDDIAVLGAILSCSAKQQFNVNISQRKSKMLNCLKYERPDASLKTIINGGRGIVSELVGKWIVSCGCDPKYLFEQPENAIDAATTIVEDGQPQLSKDSSENILPINDKSQLFFKHLSLLRTHFPFSLQSGILLVHLTWEYLCHWSKNMSNLMYLKDGLHCLASIQQCDYQLKHGLCCMIWNAHLRIPLDLLRKLINKTGRLPKEKLCMQDVGISDSLIPQFLELCAQFIDNFINSSIDQQSECAMELRFEDILHDGPVPLTILAIQQKPANLELLKPHKQLIEILYIIASLSIRYPKPIVNLFDPTTNVLFFTEINQQKLLYKLPKADDLLQKRRVKFLYTSITATMDLIREDLQSVYFDEHNQWMDRFLNLANIWELDVVQLKKHQIIELYAHNWDSYAEELLEHIVDKQNIGQLLLKIAGRRLNAYVKNSPTAYVQVVSVGPLIADYLDTLNESAVGNDDTNTVDVAEFECKSLENLIDLAGKAFKCLSQKDTIELRLAGQIFDACMTLKENIID